jgi:hypothetical protein
LSSSVLRKKVKGNSFFPLVLRKHVY